MPTLFSQNTLKKALNQPCKLRKIDANHFRVAGSKGFYIVAFTVDKKGLPAIESCRDAVTKRQCRGFKYNEQCCYHGASVAIRVVNNLSLMREGAKR